MITEHLSCPGCRTRYSRTSSSHDELTPIVCPCGNYKIVKYYCCKNGHRFRKSVSYFDAPKILTCKCGADASIYIGKVSLSVLYKGPGWAGTSGKERFKVSWGEVEKITKESDRLSKEADKANRKNIKENIIEHL